jgi:hypothetical protein
LLAKKEKGEGVERMERWKESQFVTVSFYPLCENKLFFFPPLSLSLLSLYALSFPKKSGGARSTLS